MGFIYGQNPNKFIGDYSQLYSYFPIPFHLKTQQL